MKNHLFVVFEPWFNCVWVGVMTLSLPWLWKLRARYQSYKGDLRKIAWAVRAVGVLLLLSGIWTVVRAGQATNQLLEAAADVAISIAILGLSGIIARMLIGPAAMQVPPENLSLFWKASRNAGAGLLAAGALLLIAARS